MDMIPPDSESCAKIARFACTRKVVSDAAMAGGTSGVARLEINIVSPELRRASP